MTKGLTRFNEGYPFLIRSLTWLMRLIVGGLFLFSGFTKGIDVWGTIYKFNEYFSVWGYEVWEALNQTGVFTLCLAEFLTGFCLVTGCFRRTAPIVALIIMAFMLPLTLWLAIKNPVSDCGCFGDALKLTNWETFFKNIILTIGALWLVLFNKKAICLITPYLQWIAMLASGLYILAISWIGFYYQPLIDFRPYKIGTELVEEDTDDQQDDEDDLLRFVYSKEGMEKEFTINDELPSDDSGWVFERRYYIDNGNDDFKLTPKKELGATKNLRFYSEDGHEDLTYELEGEDKLLILFIPHIDEVRAARTWQINSLYDWCKDHDVEMIAAVGGNPYQIDKWKDLSLAQYPIYTSDDTAIEEVVRGNPGVVYVENGIIRWKSSLRALSIDDFKNMETPADPTDFAYDNDSMLRKATAVYSLSVIILIVLSFLPRTFSLIIRKKRN